jgi:pyrrolidone-carboxylate peptidase
MNPQIKKLAIEAGLYVDVNGKPWPRNMNGEDIEGAYARFAELIVKDCIDKIETHRIPVGNSAAGEMACEWTYAALKEIRDEIKQHLGVE